MLPSASSQSRAIAGRIALGIPTWLGCALSACWLGALLTSVSAGAAETVLTPKWEPVAPGVWKATIGSPEDLTLLSAAGQAPQLAALAGMPAATFPLAVAEIEARPQARRTALRFPLGLDEDIYGLGVDFKSLRRTGSVFQLHVDHWSGRTGRTHAPVPLYISTRGYGVLIDSSRYVNFSVGLGVRLAAKDKPPVVDRTTGGPAWSSLPRSDSVEASVPAGGVVVYVFAGPTPLDAVRRYNLFCGGGALPPKWGLGFLTRTPIGYSAQEALADVDEFRQRGIPLDMLGLEPGWHDQAYPCSFEWDQNRFPDPAGFLAGLEKRHVRANLWFNPYVSPTAPLYAQLLPYAGSHLVWNGIVPDYSLPQPRKIFADHLLKKIIGVNPMALGGFKIDEVDGGDQWLWPDHASFPSGHDGEQLRQTYGLFLQRTLMEVFRGQNRRTLGQVRGTNAGASSFPFVIYNDNYDFNEYITAVANTSFAGVLWSPEVRGGTGEDMLRRVQAVCFSPLALFNGWATNTKLWTHADVAGQIRDVIMLRQRLLPYWYTTFAQYHYQGTPVIRAMPLIAGFRAPAAAPEPGKLDATANPYAIGKVVEVKDQYLVGEVLLVAPIAPGVASRKVTLPPGRWYDFYSGKLAGENETIDVSPPLSQIPLFVKDGGLIPLTNERQWAPGREEAVPLEVRHYGESPGELSLYDDDGETFNYERGECSWTKLRVAKDATGAWQGEVTAAKDARPWRYSTVTWRFMTTPVPAQAPAIQMAPPAAGLPALPAVVRNETPEQQEARLNWFREARFGLFIHWGVYAVPAGFWQGKPVGAEWIMFQGKIPVADYKAFAKGFTAAKYDPRAWAALAKEAGIKYIVITAKHHDGFALYDSAYSDWNAVKASGAGRDLIRPLADAARAQGLRFGVYYSQSQDWVNPGGGKGRGTGWDDAQKGDFDEYLAKISLPQARELVAKFNPDILWWDTEYQMTPERARPFFDLVTSHPHLIHNSRLGGGVLGDFRTSEQRIPASAMLGRALEVNMTINRSWGYRSDDTDWKSSQQLIRNLSDITSKDGNYLLNVGPTAEGEIPAPEVERLLAIGRWLNVNGEAIYATQGGPFSEPLPWGRTTQKARPGGGTILYVHVWEWPADGKILLPGIKQAARSGRLLAGGPAVASSVTADGLAVTLPGSAPDPDVSVAALEFDGPIEIMNAAPLPTDTGASGTLADPSKTPPPH